MLSALSDLRLVLRRLRGRPAASAAAVATLAVGIGGAVAIFSLWDALLLRPLGFREPDRLVEIEERDGVDGRDLPGWATFEDWRTRSHSVSAMAATSLWMPTLTGGEAERLVGFRVGPGYFDMLGVEPVVGRVFLPEEDVRGRHRVVVLADGLWRRHFGGDRSIVGRAISIEGIDFLVVGVLPRGFEPPVVPGSTPSTPEIFTPLAYNSSLGWACRTCHHLHVIGRLAPGATLASAAADLDAIGKSLARAYPKEYNGGGATRLVSSPPRAVPCRIAVAAAPWRLSWRSTSRSASFSWPARRCSAAACSSFSLNARASATGIC